MLRLSAAVLLAGLSPVLLAADAPADAPKPPSAFTVALQQKVREALPFSDRADFARVEQGLIKRPEQLVIRNEDGSVAWQLGGFGFLDAGQDIDSINPSLQRQALLNLKYGLYKVADGIYQVRGFDLANITFVQGDSGWIIIDTLTTPATSKAAYALVSQELGQRPIKAIIYSHAHVDHFGGVKGLVSQEQVDKGEVQIIASRSDDVLTVGVRDNGVGLPEGKVGSGLGTQIVRTLIQGELGGTIDWHTLEGEGTEVTIEMPLHYLTRS